jgi:hypothetical protein
MVADGTVQKNSNGDVCGLPTVDWYVEHNIFSVDTQDDFRDFQATARGDYHYSLEVQYADAKISLAALNDSTEISFENIANIIERQVHGT